MLFPFIHLRIQYVRKATKESYMQVSKRMTKNPITVSPETPVPEAREKMKKEKVHRLPVIDKIIN